MAVGPGPQQRPQTRNPKPEFQNPKPEPQNPKPKTRNPKPETQWLGVRPTDLDRYNVPNDCRLDLTPHDIAFAVPLNPQSEPRQSPHV